MKQQIAINKEWYDRLVALIDTLAREADLNDSCQSCKNNHGWMSHLLGYVHSLDIYFKEDVGKSQNQ